MELQKLFRILGRIQKCLEFGLRWLAYTYLINTFAYAHQAMDNFDEPIFLLDSALKCVACFLVFWLFKNFTFDRWFNGQL